MPRSHDTAKPPALTPLSKPHQCSTWVHVAVSLSTVVLCLLWLDHAGELDLIRREFGWQVTAESVVPPQHPYGQNLDMDPPTGLIDAISPSYALWNRLRRSYRANTARLRKQLNGSLPVVESYIDILFQSPIYRLNLRDLGVDPSTITREVADIILHEYYTLVNSSKDEVLEAMEAADRARKAEEHAAAVADARQRGKSSLPAITSSDKDDRPGNADGGKDEDGDTSLLNDAFFVWQSESGGWEKMFSGKSVFHKVHGFWGRAADHFLRSMGNAPVFEGVKKQKQPQMQAWATVHKACVFHGSHHHGEDIMSGVFYVKMPDKAGKISFYDPRGVHAPFDGKITVQPQEGDIVLFPTSLVHQVTPTEGETERISIAVNLMSSGNDKRGSDAMPTGLINPGDSVAMPDVMSDELYELD